MSAPSVDFGLYLENNNIASADGYVYYGDMPDNVGACITIYDYAGEPLGKADNIEYPAIQVAVRAATYSQAYQRAAEIQELLHGISNEIINGHKYLSVFAKQSPFLAGARDSQGRYIVKQNYQIARV